MLCASNRDVSRTIGHGRGGVTDKILHGSDSRHQMHGLNKTRSEPPTLQDLVFQSLSNQLVRLVLVDETDIVGRIMWYSAGKVALRRQGSNIPQVLQCGRVVSLTPVDLHEEAIPFLSDSLRADLLAAEERSSRLQIVRRRIKERNSRIEAAAKYSTAR